MILFHDVDGCLNGEDARHLGYSVDGLPAQNARELKELGELLDQSAVEHFVLNTGRSWQATEYLCHAIGSPKARYALVEHGAALWDAKSQHAIDLVGLAKERRLEHISNALESLDEVTKLIDWYESSGAELLATEVASEAVLVREHDQNANLTMRVPEGLQGHVVLSVLQRLASTNGLFKADSFVYHYSPSERFIDVLGLMDKGLGVEIATSYLNGDVKETAGVGNGSNDLAMLERVALPICPSNAEPAVKALCAERGVVSSRGYIGAVKSWLESDLP